VIRRDCVAQRDELRLVKAILHNVEVLVQPLHVPNHVRLLRVDPVKGWAVDLSQSGTVQGSDRHLQLQPGQGATPILRDKEIPRLLDCQFEGNASPASC
jgi:hypothetical protein